MSMTTHRLFWPICVAVGAVLLLVAAVALLSSGYTTEAGAVTAMAAGSAVAGAKRARASARTTIAELEPVPAQPSDTLARGEAAEAAARARVDEMTEAELVEAARRRG